MEGATVVMMDGYEVGIRRKDTDPEGQSLEISAGCSILVVLRHVHRMEPNGVYPMPSEYIGQRSLIDRQPVVDRSLLD